MQHPARVGEGEGVTELDEDLEQGEEAVRVASDRAAEQALEALALDQLHREIQLAPRVAAELVDRHDVGMVELTGDLRLAEEAADHHQVTAVMRVQQLRGRIPL